MPKVPYPYEVNGHRKWFLNTNLFLIKQFLNAKFDCTSALALRVVSLKDPGNVLMDHALSYIYILTKQRPKVKKL